MRKSHSSSGGARECFDTLNSLLKKTLQDSQEYSALLDTNRMRQVLTLADRLELAFASIPDIKQGASIPRILASVGESADETSSAERMLAKIEVWYKALYYLLDKEDYEEMKTGPRKDWNLFRVTMKLGLLNGTESNLDFDCAKEIEDPGRRAILMARLSRNPETHDPAYDADPREMLSIGLTAVLAPLHKRYDELQRSIGWLIVWEPDGEDSQLLDAIGESRRVYQGHIENYGERELDLTGLVGDLPSFSKTKKRLLAITGPQHVGKSALVSRLIQRRAENRPGSAPSAQQTAPWLPYTLFHAFTGRQTDCYSALVSIHGQVKCLLLESPAIRDERSEDPAALRDIPHGSPAVVLAEDRASPALEDRDVLRGQRLQGVDWPPGHSEEAMPHIRITIDHPQEGQRQSKNSIETMAKRVHRLLEELVRERGPTLLVIDGLDEMRDPEDITYLPLEKLPEGLGVIVTCRANSRAELLLSAVSGKVDCRVDMLTREEVPHLTGVSDAECPSGDGREFNDRVHEATRGWTWEVSKVGDAVRQARGDFSGVLVVPGNDRLEEMASRWTSSALRKALLPLFAYCERVENLSLDEVQSYLLSQGHELDLAELREEIKCVQDQLSSIEEGSIALNLSRFAEYVREVPGLYSGPDWKRHCTAIHEWFLADDAIRLRPSAPHMLFESLVSIVFDNDQLEEMRRRELVRRCVECTGEDLRNLWHGYLDLQQELGEFERQGIKRHVDLLRAFADEGPPWAMRDYAIVLSAENPEEGRSGEAREWLQKAALAEDPAAMRMRAEDLCLESAGSPCQEALVLMRKAAAADDVGAMELMGRALVLSTADPELIDEGLGWVEKAIADHDSLDARVTRGEWRCRTAATDGYSNSLWEICRCANKGSVRAALLFPVFKRALGEFFEDEGYYEKEYRRAYITTPSPDCPGRLQGELEMDADLSEREQCAANIELAEFAFENEELFHDSRAERGKVLLKEAAEKGHTRAWFVLGHRLHLEAASVSYSQGQLPYVTNEALEMLARAIEGRSSEAAVWVALLALDRVRLDLHNNDATPVSECIPDWGPALGRACQAGYGPALVLAGKVGLFAGDRPNRGPSPVKTRDLSCLYRDKESPQVEAVQYLRQAASAGIDEGQLYLGLALVSGILGRENRSEGTALLSELAEREGSHGDLDRERYGSGYQCRRERYGLVATSAEVKSLAEYGLGLYLWSGGVRFSPWDLYIWCDEYPIMALTEPVGDRPKEGLDLIARAISKDPWYPRGPTIKACAMDLLATTYAAGVNVGKSPESARFWCDKTIEYDLSLGFQLPVLTIRVAEHAARFVFGRGVVKDVERGIRILLQDCYSGYYASRGRSKVMSMALSEGGLCYLCGDGVEVDVSRGLMALDEAANLDDGKHCVPLGADTSNIMWSLGKSPVGALLQIAVNLATLEYEEPLESPYQDGPDWRRADEIVRVGIGSVAEAHDLGAAAKEQSDLAKLVCAKLADLDYQAPTASPSPSARRAWSSRLKGRARRWRPLPYQASILHLSVAWMVRHGLVEDPDGLTIEGRLYEARKIGLEIPTWMNEPWTPEG